MSETIQFDAGKFCWIDLSAHDMDAAGRWYSQLFNWEVIEPPPGSGHRYAMFAMQGKLVGGLSQLDDGMIAQGIPPMWNQYIASKDCAATEAKARELGAEITVPTTEVGGDGSMAFFKDPTGGHSGVWQSAQHAGVQLVGQPNSMCWQELMTRDVEGAKRFYSELFGWRWEEVPMPEGTYWIAKLGDAMVGGLMGMDGPMWEGIPPHWMNYIAVADTDAICAKARETGGSVKVEPMDIPSIGRFAVLADPQGAIFSVLKLAEMPA